MKAHCALLALLVSISTALTAQAQESGVRLQQGPNGRRMIANDGPAPSLRRFPSQLRVPDAQLEPMIAQHAGNQQLDPKLVKAVIQVESGYRAGAVSRKGAVGLMQLMPGTASNLAVRDRYDPDQNVRGGTTYLRQMLDRFEGRVELAVAAYNAGPGAVEKHRGIPPFAETRDYVRRVLALYRGFDRPDIPLQPVLSVRAAKSNGPHSVSPVRRTQVVRGPNNRLLVTTALVANSR
jgi:Transglycosylase SLT domain